MLMLSYESEHLPSPAEQALEIAAEVYDLRNRLLFDRVGQEGMQALADQLEGDDLFRQLETEVTPQSLALESIFRAQEHEELSRDLFDNRSLSELDPMEKERVQTSAEALREQSHTDIYANANMTPVERAANERNKLDSELNRVYNTPVVSGFRYDGSRQGVDRVVLHDNNVMSMLTIPIDGVKLTYETVIEKINGQAQAQHVPVVIDEKTHLPLDLRRVMHDSLGSTEEDQREMAEWLQGHPCNDSEVKSIKIRLEGIKKYLEGQLQDRQK